MLVYTQKPIYSRQTNRLEELGLSRKIALKVVESLPVDGGSADGSYFNGLIKIAMMGTIRRLTEAAMISDYIESSKKENNGETFDNFHAAPCGIHAASTGRDSMA